MILGNEKSSSIRLQTAIVVRQHFDGCPGGGNSDPIDHPPFALSACRSCPARNQPSAPSGRVSRQENRVTLFRILNHTNDSLGFIFVESGAILGETRLSNAEILAEELAKARHPLAYLKQKIGNDAMRELMAVSRSWKMLGKPSCLGTSSMAVCRGAVSMGQHFSHLFRRRDRRCGRNTSRLFHAGALRRQGRAAHEDYEPPAAPARLFKSVECCNFASAMYCCDRCQSCAFPSGVQDPASGSACERAL